MLPNRSWARLGGNNTRFVLATSGYVAALVNPPGNPKASFRVGPLDQHTPGQWLTTPRPPRTRGGRTTTRLAGRTQGRHVEAPKALGNADFEPLDPRPRRPRQLTSASTRKRNLDHDIAQPRALLDLVGCELGTTDWLEITQDRVNLFADATGNGSTPTAPRRVRSAPPSRTAS